MIRQLLAFALLPLTALAQPNNADSPPNILLVLADDLGYNELGSYGQEKIQTPVLDRLAAEGLRFTRFYSASTVCAPARASLMTGLHTGLSPIRGNTEAGGWGPEAPEGQRPLPAEYITLAERLQGAGYATGAFGKWGLGGPGSEGHPNHQGFDHFYGYLCQRVAHNFYPTHLWRNHDVDVQHNNDYFSAHQRLQQPLDSEHEYYRRFGGVNEPGGMGGDYSAESIIDEAERWIADTHQADPDQPLFLYYPTTIPHVALQAPREWVERYPADWDLPHDQTDNPAPDTDPATGHYLGSRGYTPHPRPRAAYAAMISYFDDSVGRLLAALDAAGRLDNTIVIVTSDNGTTFAGGVDRHFFDSLSNLRGYKTNLYEGGIRVPCLVWWPGRVPAGSTTDTPTILIDLYATLCTIAGDETTQSFDRAIPSTSLDLTPLLTNPAVTPEHLGARDVLYWEFPEGRKSQAVLLDGRYKAIRPNLTDQPDQLELYDLENDPGETSNLVDARPDLVERARRAMIASRVPNPHYPMPALDD
ncbi:MAG: arylsulfatase [Phycisphaerales bacterium JB040]